MHGSRFSKRHGFLAGTALALILTASAAIGAPANSGAPSDARDYSTPGSMPKPSSMVSPTDNGIRFRGALPSPGEAAPAARNGNAACARRQ